MSPRTYAPGPSWVPAAYAGVVLVAYYVIGPAIARVLFWNHIRKIDDAIVELPHTEGETP